MKKRILDMKVPNRKLQLFLILIIVSSITGYYVIDYAYPRYNYKHTLYLKVRNDSDFQDVSDNKIESCVDCTYEGLIQRYGKVKFFPNNSSLIPQDVKIILTCAAKYLYNKEEREFYLNNMDSIVNARFTKSQ